jgi:ElaB/YqjD/DUF883 family membrane-anchored ribosome-binding protein
MAEGRGRIGRIVESAGDRAIDAKEWTEDFVKKRPFTSMAIAAAVGALLALGVSALIGREKKRTWKDRIRDYF